MPGRDLNAALKLLGPMVADPNLAKRVDQAAPDATPKTASNIAPNIAPKIAPNTARTATKADADEDCCTMAPR